jgi:hypothetical protein
VKWLTIFGPSLFLLFITFALVTGSDTIELIQTQKNVCSLAVLSCFSSDQNLDIFIFSRV